MKRNRSGENILDKSGPKNETCSTSNNISFQDL